MWYRCYMSGNHKVVVGNRGRLVIPADVRDRAGIEEGTVLSLIESTDGLLLLTRKQLLDLVRADLAGLDLVGELLAERRRAAREEDGSSTQAA